MSEKVLIGVDIGTSSVKIVSYNIHGERLLELKEKIGLSIKGDFIEQDPMEIYYKTIKLLKKTIEEIESKTYVIGFSGQSPTLLVLDSNGEPLTNVITWMDRRGVKESKTLAREFGSKDLYYRTGLRPDPMFLSSKILWIKENIPEVFNKARYFVQIKDYVYYKLTGLKKTDYSHASETQLMNIRGVWDNEILSFIGISEDQLFEPKDSEYIAEVIEPHIVSSTVKVYAVTGGVDSACATLGVGAIEEGIIADISGTSTCIDIPAENPVMDYDSGFEVYRHVVKNTYLLEACLPTSGIAIDKVVELLGLKNKSYNDIIESTSIGANGVISLPFLKGTRSPDWNPYMKGLVYGLSLTTRPEDIVRSFMEGIGFWCREILDIAKKLGIQVNEVRVCGGESKSDLLTWLKAQILNTKVVQTKEPEASALGAAFLAGKGYGIYNSYNEINNIVKISKVYEPEPEVTNKYTKIYTDKYLRIRKFLKDLYQEKEVNTNKDPILNN